VPRGTRLYLCLSISEKKHEKEEKNRKCIPPTPNHPTPNHPTPNSQLFPTANANANATNNDINISAPARASHLQQNIQIWVYPKTICHL